MLADNILTEVFHLSNIYSMKVVILSIPIFFACMPFSAILLIHLTIFCVELNLWSVHCIHFVCVHWMEYFNTGKLLYNSRYSHGFHGGFVHTCRLCVGPCNYIVSMQSQLLVWSQSCCNWSLHSLHWSACLRWLLHGLSRGYHMQTWVVLLVSAATAALRLQNWEQRHCMIVQ